MHTPTNDDDDHTPGAAALRRVPEHLRGGLLRYLHEHIPTGGFLSSVLSNDLVGAVARGDPASLAGLVPLVLFLCNHAPAAAFGSPERVQAWLTPTIPLLTLTAADLGDELTPRHEDRTLVCPECYNRHLVHHTVSAPGLVWVPADGQTKNAHKIAFLYCGLVRVIVVGVDGQAVKR
jgi:hypothetical protein